MYMQPSDQGGVKSNGGLYQPGTKDTSSCCAPLACGFDGGARLDEITSIRISEKNQHTNARK